MQKIHLYRYTQHNVVIITPVKRNEVDTPHKMRLVADDGYVLKNGETIATAVDTNIEDIELWTEISEIGESDNLKSQAYDILMGVTE